MAATPKNQTDTSKFENTAVKEASEATENQQDASKEVSATLENKINTSKSENVTASETPKSIKKRDIPDAYDSNSMLRSANESLTQPLRMVIVLTLNSQLIIR